MDDKKKLGVGIGGAVTAFVLATCPLQLALFGALGLSALGLSPWLERFAPALYLVAAAFTALAVYGLVRLRRARKAPYPETLTAAPH